MFPGHPFSYLGDLTCSKAAVTLKKRMPVKLNEGLDTPETSERSFRHWYLDYVHVSHSWGKKQHLKRSKKRLNIIPTIHVSFGWMICFLQGKLKAYACWEKLSVFVENERKIVHSSKKKILLMIVLDSEIKLSRWEEATSVSKDTAIPLQSSDGKQAWNCLLLG